MRLTRTPHARAGRASPLDLLFLLLIYLAVTCVQLCRYPTPWVDEGWIGEVAARAALGQPLGSPSHGVLYRYADRVFWMPHLQFELLGAWFRAGHVSLQNGRLFSVAGGAGATLLLFIFLRRRFARPAAWLGALLFCTDTFAWKAHRTIRFEPTLTLLYVALALTLDAAIDRDESRRPGATRLWLLAGALLAALLNVHPNAFLLAAGATAFILARRGPRGLATRGPWLAAGLALLGLAPFALYAAGDAANHYANLAGQNSFHFGAHGRSGLPFLSEWHRYADYFPWPARTPAALAWLVIAGWGLLNAGQPAVRGLVALAGVPLLGLTLLPNKSLLYLVPELPFLAGVAAAWVHTSTLDSHRVHGAGRYFGRWARPAAGLALLLILANVAVNVALLRRNAGQDPARAYAALRARLRPDDRVAGTFVTWWAAQPLPFREFHRVESLADLKAFHPTVVLLGDRHWQEARDTKFNAIAAPIEAWAAAVGTLDATVDDPGLGAIRVYRIVAP